MRTLLTLMMFACLTGAVFAQQPKTCPTTSQPHLPSLADQQAAVAQQRQLAAQHYQQLLQSVHKNFQQQMQRQNTDRQNLQQQYRDQLQQAQRAYQQRMQQLR